MNNLCIHLPATERETILRAWAIEEEGKHSALSNQRSARADRRPPKADSRTLTAESSSFASLLLLWLRSELSGATPDLCTHNLNRVIKRAKEIIE